MIAKERRKEKRRFLRGGGLCAGRPMQEARVRLFQNQDSAEGEGFDPTIPSVTCLEFGGSPLEQEPGYAAGVSRMTNTQLIKEGKIKKSNHLQREC